MVIAALVRCDLRAASAARLFSTETSAGGLRRLRREERHGIVWVAADARSDPLTVREWLGDDLDDLLAGFGLDAMVCHGAADFDLGCIWKMLTDGSSFWTLFAQSGTRRSRS